MLQAIRDGSKGVVAKVIVGLIILTFALFGIESIVSLGGGDDAPATVNGEDITELQISQMISIQKRRLQSQFGESFDPSLIDDRLLKQSATESLINETLLKQASVESGIWFSDAQIDKIIVNSPEFQVNGAFDRDRYDQLLRSAGFTRTTHRNLLRANMSTQQTQSAWQATSFSTPLESNIVSQLELQQRDFSIANFSFKDIKSKVTVSDADISSYYLENQSEFMSDESAIVDYILLDRASFKNIDISDDQIEQRYADIQAESNAKKEYRAAHILFLSPTKESKEQLSAALMRINSGESFNDIAKELSEDDSSKFSGGDLGFSQLSVYEAEFSNALRELKVGQVSDVVETRDGLHLIKLLEVRQPEVVALSDIKDSILADLKAEASQALYIERIEILKDEAFSSGNLSAPADILGLTLNTSVAITHETNVAIFNNPAVNSAVFSDLVLNEGANSEVIQYEDGKAIVVHLNMFNESKVKPLEIIKTQITDRVRTKLAKAEIKRVSVAALENIAAADVKWNSFKARSRFDKAFDASILDRVFAMSLTQDNPSVASVNLPDGDVSLVKLEAINRELASTDMGSTTQKVQRGRAYNEFKAYQQNLKDTADLGRQSL